MELQFYKHNFPYLRQLKREQQNQELTQEIRLPEGMPDIGRVLSAWGQVLIRGKEWRNGEMGVSGGVMAWVLYAPEDGSAPQSVETWMPFQMKWDVPPADRDGMICAQSLLRSMDARSTSARKLMVRAGVGVMGEAVVMDQAETYSPDQLPEDIQLLRRTYPVDIPCEFGERAFEMDEEFTLPEGPMAKKLIHYSFCPQIRDQRVMAGKVVFRGDGILRVLYQTEDGALRNAEMVLPFSQYGELEQNYEDDATAVIYPLVTGLELDLNEEGKLRMKAAMSGQYQIRDRRMLELVEDAYSPYRKVTPIKEMLELPTVLDTLQQTMWAEQNMTAEGNQIADISFYPDYPRQIQAGEDANVEVPGYFQMLYYDNEGKLQSGTAKWEGSWTIPMAPENRLEITMEPSGVPQGSIMGGNAQMQAELNLTAATVSRQGIPMVTALETGEQTEPDPNRPSLILRRMGEESLWDIAKETGSTVTGIAQANGLQTEPVTGQILLIPIS